MMVVIHEQFDNIEELTAGMLMVVIGLKKGYTSGPCPKWEIVDDGSYSNVIRE